jgi:hypothetical protein
MAVKTLYPRESQPSGIGAAILDIKLLILIFFPSMKVPTVNHSSNFEFYSFPGF